MLEHLRGQVNAKPELAEKICIADSRFGRKIRRLAADRTGKQYSRLLATYEAKARETNLEQLYFPLHVNDNHFIAGMIDFKNSFFAYGA